MNLNQNEKIVLSAVIDSASANGMDFGFSDEVAEFAPSIAPAALGGYMSQLSQKGFITVHAPESVDGKLWIQITLNFEAIEAAGIDLFDAENWAEILLN
jgi:hypothetical protein